jgi:flagellar hook-associated protein 1 FlgK
MSLGSALAIAMSGLRANQAALSIVSSNIANAQTPGYVTQRTHQVETLTGDTGASVSVTGTANSINSSRLSCVPKHPAAPMPTRWQTS